jgi:hypothetical protein
MVDYSIDSSYDIRLGENQTFATVDGIEEFEEDLIIAIDFRFSGLIGEYKNIDTATQKLRLLIRRLAESSDIIDQIQRIVISEPKDKPETFTVEIFYISDRTFEETI